MQLNQQELEQQLRDKMMSEEITFPISDMWYQAAQQALDYASPMSLGVTSSEMKSLDDKLRRKLPLNCFEFALASNNLEMRTPKEIASCYGDYWEVMSQAEGYVKQWNELTRNWRDEIVQEAIVNNPQYNGAPVKKMMN